MRDTTARHFRQVESLPEPARDIEPAGNARVMVLASGSKGNCILIAYGQHAIMIDCGITPEEAARRSRSVGYPLTQLDAVCLTHWHKDHCKHVSQMCQQFHCPLVCSKATMVGLETQPAKHRRAIPGEILDTLSADSPFEVIPIKIEHEEGSLAYHIRVGGKNIVVAHDLGAHNSTLLAAARAADCLCIEANHDSGLVESCVNPNHTPDLHKRILSADRGHMSNAQCAEVVSHVDPNRIQSVCALHLSGSHNTEELAEASIRAGIPEGARPALYMARQDSAVLIEVNRGLSPLELSLVEQFRMLDRKVDAIIGEQKQANSETSERRTVLGEYMVEMESLFESKDPGATLCGFDFFTNWLAAKSKDLGVSERMMFYYYKDAKVIVPLLGREVAKLLPLGTASELAKYAAVKGEIPTEMLQYAQEHPAHEVKAKVASILYPGKTGHFEGPEDHLTVTCRKAQVDTLRKKLDVARRFVGETASDADVIEFALEEFIQSHQQEDAAEVAIFAAHDEDIQPSISSFPAPPDFDIESILEETDATDTARHA